MAVHESIRTKLRRVILLTCASVLALTVISFLVYEITVFRQSHAETITSIAQVLAENATSSLAFKDPEDAEELLRSLRTEPTIRRAVIFDSGGKLFAHYPHTVATNELPRFPGGDRVRYESGSLLVVMPIFEERREGTLWMESDLTPLYRSLSLFALIVVLVLISSFALAIIVSSWLQQKITTPILELAGVAREISDQRDYSVRAQRRTEDEIGVLTEAFNHMLGQISERDAALTETAERLRLAMEASRIGAWSWDVSRNRFVLDEHLHALLGLEAGKFEGTYEAFLALIHPEDRPGIERILARAIEKRRDFIGEYRVTWPDQSVHYMSSRGRSTEKKEGGVTMAGVTIDVTESKKAEQALRESEERFRTMAEAAPVMIWTAHPDGEWNYCNHLWLQFTGRTLDQELGQGWQASIHPDDLNRFSAIYSDAIRKGVSFDTEFRLRRADGEYRWMQAQGVPRIEKDLRLTGFIGSCLDITDIKLAQNELEQRVEVRTAELAETNRELEAFTYSVSHDLRAPLRHINAYAQILEEECGAKMTEEAQKYVERIRQGTKNMGRLVDDLLNLARVGRQELMFQSCRLNAAVDEAMRDLPPEAAIRPIEWKIGDLGWAECDPGLIKQVFANLLANAVKYTRKRDPAIIEVSRFHDGSEDVIRVKDNGVGFSMKYAGKLFGVFQRLHRVEDYEGTGVGLATVDRIIRKHGGRIWADSELDKGATFYFTLGESRMTPPPADSLE